VGRFSCTDNCDVWAGQRNRVCQTAFGCRFRYRQGYLSQSGTPTLVAGFLDEADDGLCDFSRGEAAADHFKIAGFHLPCCTCQSALQDGVSGWNGIHHRSGRADHHGEVG